MLLLSDQFSINVLSMHYQSMNYCYALIPATCYQSVINGLSICYQHANVFSSCYQRSVDMLSTGYPHAANMSWSSSSHALNSNRYSQCGIIRMLPIRSSGGGGYVINNCFYYCLLFFNASPPSRPDRLKTIYVFHHRL